MDDRRPKSGSGELTIHDSIKIIKNAQKVESACGGAAPSTEDGNSSHLISLKEDNFEVRVFLPWIPSDVLAPLLEIYLEHKKRGDDNIWKFEFDENKEAYVSFLEPSVTRSFLDRSYIKIKEQNVRITELPRLASTYEEELLEFNSILVQNVWAEDLTMVEMYFDNKKRSGGGSVKSIEQISGTSNCLITFENAQVVEEVLSRSHELRGVSLSVARPSRKTNSPGGSLQVSDKIDNSHFRPTSIRVAGTRIGAGEELVKMFFENKKRSGGGAVSSCKPSGDGFVVTFEDPDVAEEVIRRHARKPLELGNSVLDISVIPPTPAFSSIFPGLEESWLVEDGSTSCAVKITGLPVNAGSNLELMKMFFENRRRSGGGGRVEVVPREEENYAIVVFEESQVVGMVLKQYDSEPFTLNKCRLTVELLRPLPIPALPAGELCPKSLLCRGIYSGTTPLEIKKFFRDRLNWAVDRLVFCLKPDIVLVQFEIEFDYCKAIKAFRSWPLWSDMVSLERVPVSKSVQVHNYGSLSDQSLVLHLENPRGVNAEVSKVEEKKEDGCMIVHFEDGSVIPRLLENPPIIDGHQLQFRIYNECMGIIHPGVNSSEPVCLLPPDVQLKFDPDVLKHIAGNNAELDKLEKELATEFCVVVFPKHPGDDRLTLVCQLKNNCQEQVSLSKDWTRRCTEKASKFISEFTSIQIGVLQDFWIKLKKKLTEEMQSARGEFPAITLDDASHLVSFVGRKKIGDELERKVKSLITEIEQHMEIQKGTVTEKVECLKMHQFKLLKSIDFFEEEAGPGGVKVIFDKNIPILVGQSGDVMAKKIKMFEILNNVASGNFKPNKQVVRMLNDTNFTNHLAISLQSQPLRVVWELGSNGVTMYGLTQTEVDNGLRILKEELVYREIPINKQTKLALQLPAWLERKNELKSNPTLIIEEGEDVIKVFATRNALDEAIENISAFIKYYAMHTKFVPLGRGVYHIITNYKQAELDAICRSFSSSFIKIQPQENGFKISGLDHGLVPAETRVKELAECVKVEVREIDRPGMAHNFLSKKGQDHLELIQVKYCLYIEKAAETWRNCNDSDVVACNRRTRGRAIASSANQHLKHVDGKEISYADNMRCSFETKICFRFFAQRVSDIEATVKELEDYCTKSVKDKVLQGDYGDCIAKLTPKQIAVIKNMESLYPVSITVDQGRLNRIRIRAETDYLLIVQEELHKIFREVDKADREVEEKNLAEVIAKPRVSDIEATVKELEDCCPESVKDKVIEGDYGDYIAKLTPKQIAVIKNLESLYPVSITVDQGRLNRIRIRAETDYLLIVQDELQKIFREVDKADREVEEKKLAS